MSIRDNKDGHRRVFFDWSLAAKFRFLYILLFFFCVGCNALIIRHFYREQIQRTVASLSSETVESVARTADIHLRTIASSSLYFLSTTDVQNYLRAGGKPDQALTNKLDISLHMVLGAVPALSSIMIIREDGLCAAVSYDKMPEILLSSPEEASWYEQVRRTNGAVVQINGGGYFRPTNSDNYISVIRTISQTSTGKTLGYLLLNVSVDSLIHFVRSNKRSSIDFCLYTPDMVLRTFQNGSLAEQAGSDPADLAQLDGQHFQTIASKRYLILNYQDPDYDWSYVAAIEYGKYADSFRPYLAAFLLSAAICLLFLWMISLPLRQFVTRPVSQLTAAIQRTESGDFHPMPVTKYRDEIRMVQQEYNTMQEKIQVLMKEKVGEQQRLRQAELNALQSQIKPHFLYNSMSSIAYLIVSGQSDRAYELLMALSDYYRDSLSKGTDIVPLSVELHIVQNYLALQKVRFSDTFEDRYEIGDDVQNCLIPKLILQPLVENALYHGILPTAEFGMITVKAHRTDSDLILQVSDDGVGMDEETRSSLTGQSLPENKESFGLRGTIERLKIFYNRADIYQIKSQPGHGTEILLTLPIRNEENNHESITLKNPDRG